MNGFARTLLVAQADMPRLPALAMDVPDSTWIIALVYFLLTAAGIAVNLGLFVQWRREPPPWRERTAALCRRPWTGIDGALLLLAMLGLYLAASFFQPLLTLALGDKAPSPDTVWMVVQSSLFHFVGLALILLSLVRRRLSWRDAFGIERRFILRDVGWGVMLYVATVPFIVFYSIVYQTWLRFMGEEPTLQEVAVVLTSENPLWIRVYLMALAVAIAPVFEEILFRGIGLPLFARQGGAGLAIVLMSLLFAGIHLHLPSLAPLFVIAVSFSLAYIHTGSILVPIVMHSLFNVVNLALLTWMTG